MKLMVLHARPDTSSTLDANHARLAAARDFLGVHPGASLDRLVIDVATPLRGRELAYVGADAIVGGDDQVSRWVGHVGAWGGGRRRAVEVSERVLLGHGELFEGRLRRRQQAGALKVVAFLVRRPDLTADQFAHYWEDHHAPLAMDIVPEECFGYAYVQNHARTASSPYDGVVEMYFRDRDHMDRWVRWFNGDEGARLRRDEHEFMLPDKRVVLVTEEHVLRP